MDSLLVKTDDKLYRISSVAAATFDTESDIIKSELSGTVAKETFISDRLRKKEQFFEPIKRFNYTLVGMGKASVVKTLSNGEALYKQQANVAFQLLVLSQEQSKKLI